jgi:hypothetical protein
MAYRIAPAESAAAEERLRILLLLLAPCAAQAAADKAIRKAGGENLAEFMAHNLSRANVNEGSGSPFQSDITFRGFRASPVMGGSGASPCTWTAYLPTNPTATWSLGTVCE